MTSPVYGSISFLPNFNDFSTSDAKKQYKGAGPFQPPSTDGRAFMNYNAFSIAAAKKYTGGVKTPPPSSDVGAVIASGKSTGSSYCWTA